MIRNEMIDQIVIDVGMSYDYKDFAADCVREVITVWYKSMKKVEVL